MAGSITTLALLLSAAWWGTARFRDPDKVGKTGMFLLFFKKFREPKDDAGPD